MVSDDPAKGLGRAAPESKLPQRLGAILGAPTRGGAGSPYFVPTAAGVESFTALARQGVKITVLTNSLEATDVVAAHAGYAKRRKPLLEAGVALFEMTRTSSRPAAEDHRLTGSSASSLHAKTFSVDRARIFIGSFNFDPRSARLNTEMGFVIDSPAMARMLANAFADGIPERAYEVRLSDTGALQWVDRVDGRRIVHDREPGAGFWLRALVTLMSVLPIEWLL
jgi:putative cardiolipin synthase